MSGKYKSNGTMGKHDKKDKLTIKPSEMKRKENKMCVLYSKTIFILSVSEKHVQPY